MPDHLRDKLKDPSNFVINPPATIEWSSTPPPHIVEKVSKIAPDINQIADVKEVNPKAEMPMPPILEPLIKSVDIIKKIVTNPGNISDRPIKEVKPVAKMGEIEIPVDYEIQEVDYNDYAQG